MTLEELQPGQRIRITQTIDRRDRDWHATVEGVLHSIETQKTGSWYAHGPQGKYWLRRLRLAKPDGELTTITVDPYTRVEVLP